MENEAIVSNQQFNDSKYWIIESPRDYKLIFLFRLFLFLFIIINIVFFIRVPFDDPVFTLIFFAIFLIFNSGLLFFLWNIFKVTYVKEEIKIDQDFLYIKNFFLFFKFTKKYEKNKLKDLKYRDEKERMKKIIKYSKETEKDNNSMFDDSMFRKGSIEFFYDGYIQFGRYLSKENAEEIIKTI